MRLKIFFLYGALLSLSASPLHAQDGADPEAGSVDVMPQYDEPQLDQMLAPIALYPDPLIGTVLMAATYPLEIVEAAHWLQSPANTQLQTEQLAPALQTQPWQPSVKSLVQFPSIVGMMDANIQWTEQIGDAFLSQQDQVAESIQRLRHLAIAEGALMTTAQQIVTEQGAAILIEPANPALVYLPVYNPTVVYGVWPYPSLPPYYFRDVQEDRGSRGIIFSNGIGVSEVLWGWNKWDWRQHRITVDDRRFSQLNGGRPSPTPGQWRHNANHPVAPAAEHAEFHAQEPPSEQLGEGRPRPLAPTVAPQPHGETESNEHRDQPHSTPVAASAPSAHGEEHPDHPVDSRAPQSEREHEGEQDKQEHQ